MNVLILGGGYAGLTAALRLARKSKLQVTLVNDGAFLVERIRLHQLAAGQPLRHHAVTEVLRGTSVRFLDARITSVDLQGHTVQAGDHTLPWDHLLLALGSRTDVQSTPGAAEHALTLDAGSVTALHQRLSTAQRLTVVGGGLTALEAATELAESHPHLQVRLVTRGRLLPGFSERAVAYSREVLARLGVEVREGTAVHAVEARQLQSSAGALPFDVCLWSAGFRGPPLPSGLEGLDTTPRGALEVDESLRARGRHDVWVAGDAAHSGAYPFTQGCKSAGPSAAWAVDNLLRTTRGEAPRPFRYFAPYFCVSLGRRAGFLQKALPDGRLLGGVVTGRAGALIKELICRFTVWNLGFERRGWASYGLFEAPTCAAPALSPRHE